MRKLLRLTILLVFMFWLTSVAAAEPQLNVVSPSEGETILGTTVKVVIKTSDFELVPVAVPVTEAGKRPDANQPGEGMVHLKLDLLPLAILDQGDTYTFTNIPPGEHQLEVELATNDHSTLSPPVVQVVRFRSTTTSALPATGATASAGADLALLIIAALALVIGAYILRLQHRHP